MHGQYTLTLKAKEISQISDSFKTPITLNLALFVWDFVLVTFKSRSFAVRVSDVQRQPKKETKSVTVVGFHPHSRLPSGNSPSWMQPSSFKSWQQAPLFIQGYAAEGAGGSQVRGDLSQVKVLLRNPSASEPQASIRTIELSSYFPEPFNFNQWPSCGGDSRSSKSTPRVHFYTPFFWGMHKDFCPWHGYQT